MHYKYQNQVERVTYPDCTQCRQIREMINKPNDHFFCGRMSCSNEFWMFKDKTMSATLAIVAWAPQQAHLGIKAKYHPGTIWMRSALCAVLSNAGPTGDYYSFMDILSPLLFESIAEQQDKLCILDTVQLPWLQTDDAAKKMRSEGFYRTIEEKDGVFSTVYVHYPLRTIAENIGLAPEFFEGTEFGYGSLGDVSSLDTQGRIDDANLYYADKKFQTKL